MAIDAGQTELIEENLMNIALGIPVGFLLSFIFTHRSWWKAALVGFIFSSVIELSQLLLKCGLCEFDDVFHNTLGCVISYGVGVMMLWGIGKVRRSKVLGHDTRVFGAVRAENKSKNLFFADS